MLWEQAGACILIAKVTINPVSGSWSLNSLISTCSKVLVTSLCLALRNAYLDSDLCCYFLFLVLPFAYESTATTGIFLVSLPLLCLDLSPAILVLSLLPPWPGLSCYPRYIILKPFRRNFLKSFLLKGHRTSTQRIRH